jgi:DNA-binding CsgD family transcriptional regulator
MVRRAARVDAEISAHRAWNDACSNGSSKDDLMLNGEFNIIQASPIALSTHATSAGRGATHVLRELAIAADVHQSRPELLTKVWSELASGAYEALDAFTGCKRCYLVLRERLAPAPSTNCRRDVDVLRRILVDGGQKCAAYDLDLAASSISSLSKRALATLGFSCAVADAPFVLFLAARAVSEGNVETAQAVTVRTELGTLRVLSVRRPDLDLECWLSPALADVASRLVAGKRRAEIASARKTSVRTVSNQLRAVFASLNATGRLSLLGALAARSKAGPTLTLGHGSSRGRAHSVGTNV